jgi:peptide-methionine (R)-S-oxide reductase
MISRHKVIKTDAEWKQLLTPEQYRVLEEKRKGVFCCAGCESPLFRTDSKFESGTGWPSFFEPENAEAVTTFEDTSYGMRRIEVRCATCDGHLGHVFPDGPRPTGLRYCINGAAFNFKAD